MKAIIGAWVPNPAQDVEVWTRARELHTAASKRADAIIAAGLPAARVKCDRELRGERHTQTWEGWHRERKTRTARNLRTAAHAPVCDVDTRGTREGWTVTRTRGTWTRAGVAAGHVTRARWHVRAYLDTLARERVESDRARELMRAGTGLTRTHAAWVRAQESGQIVGWENANVRAWDSDSPRDVINPHVRHAPLSVAVAPSSAGLVPHV